MKKKNKKLLWLEIRMVCLVALQYGLYDLWRTYRPENLYIQIALEVSCIIVTVFLFKTVRDIWRRELKSIIGMKLKMMMTRLVGIFVKYSDKLSVYFRGANVAKGKTDVSFDYSIFKTNKIKRDRFKPPKWKDMNSGREKLGYLYYKIITDRVDSGKDIYASDTPSELKLREANSEHEDRVFDIYIRTRYDERQFVSEEEMTELKNIMY